MVREWKSKLYVVKRTSKKTKTECLGRLGRLELKELGKMGRIVKEFAFAKKQNKNKVRKL